MKDVSKVLSLKPNLVRRCADGKQKAVVAHAAIHIQVTFL